MYSKKVINHFQNPHNCGKIKNPDGIGKVGNIVCGDVMYLYIKIGKNKKKEEIIKNIKFETFGCVAAISTSSVVTDLVMGKTLDEAMKLEKNNVINSLEGLPPIKIHCSILAIDALSEAIYDYLSKNKRLIPEELAKKHERIDKERHSVEEKHKDWVEKEEKMFNK
ncbi:MAG: iron-sulfur cluster assembly scaffold protein [Candidatus Nealsonbacteria bacterium CG_4_8_14_3_um_filter_39_7]|uniref:Iron-sulfur cluster assembly scaffold protein n=1 Tax=Candidatus Nealsonbacteria bacterium CG23_combo_of_CG06-09_8_20_14_all_39_17 TaxID=1974722 RepID=A0A2G9YTR6_9BACT|nr:MAG: iron-sulfur cluster assembly scaffold protein [Candidatus Nealsonbacteria bacterium CG23_combo_of_CG06-09_8_20_14_all_39_17]PIU43912.1 MAG: iron-sulfur cluster assembly scaffold protein [Candidatus Nealsonbacteria bacterium CG07_land_8_20_14_0_80_39_13]PIW91040.1 MAG: iron-sulfur cluster assembly scaffold protein [Candidatus Nealsonbacteria bacterium CG_4_8_14_3_um_filter_39_7]